MSVKQGPVKLVAMADAFPDRLKSALTGLKEAKGAQVDVPADHLLGTPATVALELPDDETLVLRNLVKDEFPQAIEEGRDPAAVEAAKSPEEKAAELAARGLEPRTPLKFAFGLLVLGSSDPNRFYAEIGTLYLTRLGELASMSLQRFLKSMLRILG